MTALIDAINANVADKALANDLRGRAANAGKQAANHDRNASKTLSDLVGALAGPAAKKLTKTQVAAITAAVGSVQNKLGC